MEKEAGGEVSKLRTAVRASVISAAIALSAGAVVIPAASASQVTVSADGAQAAYDNNPGNGAQSWVWVYAGGTIHTKVTIHFVDGSSTYVEVYNPGYSQSFNLSKDVRYLRLCASVAPFEEVCHQT
jgi:hypothetical protein